MSVLSRGIPVEFFTATSRITGHVSTRHIHVRDELNDTRLSLVVFVEMEVASLGDLRAPRLVSTQACLKKDEILLAVPHKLRGATSALTQRSIQARMGKNEHRILIEIPPFRVVGNFYFVGKFQIDDTLWRDTGQFAPLGDAEVTFLPDPAISFVADEMAFNVPRVATVCADFQVT